MNDCDIDNVAGQVHRAWGLTRENKLALLALSAVMAAVAGYTWYADRQGHTLPTRDQAAIRIDINSAGWQKLSLLPGIGEKTARLIVTDRAAHGRYGSLDDLSRIKGVGPSVVGRITPYAECR